MKGQGGWRDDMKKTRKMRENVGREKKGAKEERKKERKKEREKQKKKKKQ